MWTVGVETPFELITKSKDYTIKHIAQKIKCRKTNGLIDRELANSKSKSIVTILRL
ncbi:MAG: hypothetical protein WAM14_10600 [Candidatus Nitrosopolaris sp.]